MQRKQKLFLLIGLALVAASMLNLPRYELASEGRINQVMTLGGTPVDTPKDRTPLDVLRHEPTSTRRINSIATSAGTPVDIPKEKTSLDVQLYSEQMFIGTAYLDLRGSEASVKILNFFHQDCIKTAFYCIVRNKKVRAKQRHAYWITWGSGPDIWQAGYLSCTLPAGNVATPTAITLLGNNGTVKDVVLPVRSSMARTANFDGFAVCSKSLYGTVDAARLTEWIELTLLLGVRHIYIYSLGITGRANDVMGYYSRRGHLTVVVDNSKAQMEKYLPKFTTIFANRDATHATGAEPIVQLELLSVNDCIYRFGGGFEYVLVTDTDEVLIPKKLQTLPILANVLKNKHPGATSFLSHAAAYLTAFEQKSGVNLSADKRSELHMFQHTRRNAIGWDGQKSFHSMSDTLFVGQHIRHEPSDKMVTVDYDDAWVHHYRNSCKGNACNSDVTLFEDEPSIMGRYADYVKSKVFNVTSLLGISNSILT